MKKTALHKDMLREIAKSKARFLSLFLLTALAVAFLSGLRTTRPDMTETADSYLDSLNMMDIRIVSTLGITGADVADAAKQQGVTAAQGGWSVDALATAGDTTVVVKTLSLAENDPMNAPALVSGRLPQSASECLMEQGTLDELGLAVGGTVTLDTGDGTYADALTGTQFTVTGTCRSPLYISRIRGATSLGTGTINGIVYLPDAAYALDYYTDLYLTLDGAEELNAFSDAYTQLTDTFADDAEAWADARAAARLAEVKSEAEDTLSDAQQEYDDAEAEANQKLSDAEQELEDARKKLDDGWADYRTGKQTLADETASAQAQINTAADTLAQAYEELTSGEADYAAGKKKLETSESELTAKRAEYEAGEQAYQSGLAAYNRALSSYNSSEAAYEANAAAYQAYKAGLQSYEQGLAQYESVCGQWSAAWAAVTAAGGESTEQGLALQQQKTELDAQKAQLDAQKAQLDAAAPQFANADAQLAAAAAALAEAKAQLDASAAELAENRAVLDAAAAALTAGEQQLAAGKQQLAAARKTLDDGWAEYNDGVTQITQARSDLQSARDEGNRKLADALAELQSGEADYADGLAEYNDAKAEADEKLADAREKLADGQQTLDDLTDCTWYVLTRSANAGFVSYKNDAENMGNLAQVFPVIFFLVAALVCLTTMTRMIEDERGTIGAMKALGYSGADIARKYLGYGVLASVGGSLFGLVLGCTTIPYVIVACWGILYSVPGFRFAFSPAVYLLSSGAALLVIIGTVLATIRGTLRETPASLMRPRAPKAGRRVLLERIAPVWKRLSFSWKVTVRNLFRYKKRLWMTVIGISGCTALLVAGFGLLDSINAIVGIQYDELSVYDATANLTDGDASAQEAAALLDDCDAVTAYTAVRQNSVDLVSGSATVSGYYVVADDAAALQGFRIFRTRLGHESVELTDDGVLIAEKTADLLGLQVGDTLTLDGDTRVQVKVAGIVENYIFHYVYMTQTCYEKAFGEPAEHNMLYLCFAQDTDAACDEAASLLLENGCVESVTHLQTNRDSITDSFRVMNYAVAIIILSAAALAFVVLFNLNNINITERERELATLRVLGFYDAEVSAYVLRENAILTLIGTALGLFFGKYMHAWLVGTIEIESVMFGRTAEPHSYVYAAVLTVFFSIAANLISARKLRRIDMVEALKSAE